MKYDVNGFVLFNRHYVNIWSKNYNRVLV